MLLTVILAILFIGLALIFLEVFFTPGTTIFGVAGGLALMVGVVLVYVYFGRHWGNIALVSALVLVIALIGIGFKLIDSNALAMKAEITGKVNTLELHQFEIGERGKAISDLKPGGKAQFKGQKVDVLSTGDYIHRETEIEIVHISDNKIFVQPIKS